MEWTSFTLARENVLYREDIKRCVSNDSLAMWYTNDATKIIEECPSPFVHARPGMREEITKCAVAYALKLKYKSAGTVEFLVDNITGEFFFLEMNTRLQVEHGITELCYDIDLVALMLAQADCEKGGETGISSDLLFSKQRDGPKGAAIEVRVYAEIPHRNYAPSPGLLQSVKWPTGEGVRIDTWVGTGQKIVSFYDPLIAKIMVHDTIRSAAAAKMSRVLSEAILQGPPTNLHFLRDVVASKCKSSRLVRARIETDPKQHFLKETP